MWFFAASNSGGHRGFIPAAKVGTGVGVGGWQMKGAVPVSFTV